MHDASTPRFPYAPIPATGDERAALSPCGAVRMSEVVSALSYALDIVEGQPAGHAVRSCLLGMHVGQAIGLDDERMSSLFYALLLKDLGCSSNASKICYLFGNDDRVVKADFKTVDWNSLSERLKYVVRNAAPEGGMVDRLRHFGRVALTGAASTSEIVRIRCDRGASIARVLGLSEETAVAIRNLDEHWDGSGHPDGVAGEAIPLLARILNLAQTVEVFLARDGFDAALAMAESRSGSWFDPELVAALGPLRNDEALLQALFCASPRSALHALEPEDRRMVADDATLDRIALAFGQVVDAKSPWTAAHSQGVADVAVGIAREQGFSAEEIVWLRRAALLHDLGKLGVSNSILDKPAKLDEAELAILRRHPEFTFTMLRHVAAFDSIAELAASHHERLDGKGYHRGLDGRDLSPAARALVVADMYEALAAHRPYRKDLDEGEVMTILTKNVLNEGICPAAFEALRSFLRRSNFVPYRIAA
jgi:HD-GYP domain-containing protein (c-di-GMP phosphodiesterase class II)